MKKSYDDQELQYMIARILSQNEVEKVKLPNNNFKVHRVLEPT